MKTQNIETRLEELRKDSNFLQKDIASKLNEKEDTYSKWERGIADFSLIKANELANIYDVSLDYLLGLCKNNCKTERKNIDLKLLCNRLLKLRKENNLTQKKVGDKTGFPQTTYYGYESGKRIPTTYKLCYIALFYHVSFDYLVGRDDMMKLNK